MQPVHSVGPDNGQLLLFTGRSGVMARMGHDLTITFDDWSATISEDELHPEVAATVRTQSLRVVESTGRPNALSDEDAKRIEATSRDLLDVTAFPEITFTLVSADRRGDKGTVTGEVTICGHTGPLTLAVTRDAHTWRGSGSIHQSAFGIKQFSVMGGALKLDDEVRIAISVTTPSH